MTTTVTNYADRIETVFAAKEHPPTSEQVNAVHLVCDAFYTVDDFNDDRTIVVMTAVAGAGKTTTVVDIYNVIASDLRGKYIQAVAFNVKARDEFIARGLDKCHTKTVNGLGHANLSRWAKSNGLDLDVDAGKNSKVLRKVNNELAEIAPARRFAAKMMGFIKAECLTRFDRSRLETLADHYGVFIDVAYDECEDLYGVTYDELEDAAYGWIAAAMKRNNEVPASGTWVIDYDDQVYLPVVLGIRCFQNDMLIVDEAQDLSVANKRLIDRCLKKTGLLVLVGDDYQCIYAWRGCRVGGLESTLNRPNLNTIHAPLTYNWRSGQQIIDLAAEICPDIQCGTGRDAIVRDMDEADFDLLTEIDDDETDVAILSRLRAPLIGFAIECLKNNIPFTFQIALSFLIDSISDATDGKTDLSIRAFKRRWNAYVAAKLTQYKTLDADQAADELADTDAIIKTLLDRVRTTDKVSNLIDEIDTLQRQINEADGSLTLSTIHGAKGLEWAKTYLLGYESIGNNARRDWQEIEARNLRFVAVTRAKNEIVFINEDSK